MVTALFADIKGSTELMEDLDPEEARAIIDPALNIMVEAVRRYDGYVVQSTGDGIFSLFGAPAAYEDHPQRALYAALQMQEGLRGYGQRLSARGRRALEARIGVNTGEVVVRTIEAGGRTEYTPIGHTANLASRLQTLAPVGSISVSEDTRKLVEGYFELSALGPTAIKGISEPTNVFQVTGLGTLRGHFELAARRGLTRFVGRESELGQMRRAFEQAMAGHGQIVAVVAEAGTGKSRLFYESKATIPADCKVLEAYSVSQGKPRRGCRCSNCCAKILVSGARMMLLGGAKRSARCWPPSISRSAMRCRIFSDYSALSRATIRWRRWTGR